MTPSKNAWIGIAECLVAARAGLYERLSLGLTRSDRLGLSVPQNTGREYRTIVNIRERFDGKLVKPAELLEPGRPTVRPLRP